MNNRPSSVRVFGSSLVGNPYTPQFKQYVYGGDQFLADEPKKTRPSAPTCSEEGCEVQSSARGLCPVHYYRLVRAPKRGQEPGHKRRKTGVFRPDKCGTPAGVERHRYYGMEPCQPCRAAKSADRAARKAAKKKEASNAGSSSGN